MVSSNIEQHNQFKYGHTLRLELQDMLNSHGMKISQFQADSDVSIENHSTVQAPKLMRNVVPTNENKRIQRAWRVNNIDS
jgi:hypothetical protein